MIETKTYSDGITATGVIPLPELSPRQQDVKMAMGNLRDIESIMGGRNGPSIQLRAFLESLVTTR